MTRSGLAAATLAANDANGHRAGMLQSWNLPCSSSSASALADRFPAFRRQPVSPNAATDLSVGLDRKSTRLNSSHLGISYAVFCLKTKSPCRDTDAADEL